MVAFWLFFMIFSNTDLICLFLERGEKREKEKERNTHRLPLVRSRTADQPAPSPVPRPGIELLTFHFVGRRPTTLVWA